MRRIYDLVMTHLLDTDDFFIHCIQRYCAEARLNFFLVEPAWVEAFYDNLAQGLVWPRVLLNMHSEHHQPDEIFHRLIRLAADRNTQVIDPPDRALAAFDKARVHHRLAAAGIRLRHGLVRRRTPAFNNEKNAPCGDSVRIKPSMGYGRRGVLCMHQWMTCPPCRLAGSQLFAPTPLVPRQIMARPLCPVSFVFGPLLQRGNCLRTIIGRHVARSERTEPQTVEK